MQLQEETTLSLTGAPPPVTSFAPQFEEELLEASELQGTQNFFFGGDSSTMFRPSLAEPNALTGLGQVRSLGPVPLTVEVESEDRAILGLSGLSFTVTEDETGEMTFSNEDQGAPLRLTVIAHPTDRRMSLNINLDYRGLNVAYALAGTRFLERLSRGGEFRMVGTIPGTETRLSAIRGVLRAGEYPGPNSRVVKLFERLALIQDMTGAHLTVPEEGIAPDEVQIINMVARILETGRATYETEPWTVVSSVEQAREGLKSFEDGKPRPVTLYHPEGQVMKVLGMEVPLGQLIVGVQRTYMTEEDRERLRAELEVAGPDDKVSMRVSPYENCPAEAHYMQWLSPEDAAAIFRMPVFQHDAPDWFIVGLVQASRRGDTISIPRLAELLAALRKNVASHEANLANPIVTCTPDELLGTLMACMKDLSQRARFELAALLFKHDVLSSGKAARFAGMDRVTFLTSLHTVGVAVLDLDEEEMENQASYVNAE